METEFFSWIWVICSVQTRAQKSLYHSFEKVHILEDYDLDENGELLVRAP